MRRMNLGANLLIRECSPQGSLRLLLPMGSLALIAGVVCGFLAVILMWLAPFDETVSGSSLAAGAERFWA